MDGIWLVSYITLWLFVVLQAFLLLALLRHIGHLRLWLRQSGVIRDIDLAEEGPVIGDSLSKVKEIVRAEAKPKVSLDDNKAMLMIFVPPGMWGCEDLITAIKSFEEERSDSLQLILISFMPATAEQFDILTKRGINAPVILEYGWKVAETCRIYTAPYAFIIDHEGIVKAKKPVSNEQSLEDLIHAYQQL